MHPGDYVYVPDDASGECVFAAAGDPDDAVSVEHAGVGGGSYKRDVGWVRYPDGTTRKWKYEDIRPVGTQPSA